MTTNVREDRKQARRQAQVPQPRTYNVRLTNGMYRNQQQPVTATFGVDKVTLTTTLAGKNFGSTSRLEAPTRKETSPALRKVVCIFTFGMAPVERKVKLYGKVVKAQNGKPLLVCVDLPSTTATLSINGREFTARSYCKPPDKFTRHSGAKLALRHLLHNPKVSMLLEPDDYEALVKIFLTKPPKLSQIKRIQKLAMQVDLSSGAP